MHHSWVFSRSLICISLTVWYGKSVKTMTHLFNANVKFTFWYFNDPYSTNADNYFEIRNIMEGKHNQNIWKQFQIVTYFWWIYFLTILLGVNHRSSVKFLTEVPTMLSFDVSFVVEVNKLLNRDLYSSWRRFDTLRIQYTSKYLT